MATVCLEGARGKEIILHEMKILCLEIYILLLSIFSYVPNSSPDLANICTASSKDGVGSSDRKEKSTPRVASASCTTEAKEE